ncbi:MAG: DNA-directed RNA polymerase subunit E'' [Candidatus Aenigmarchaeota archaeon]|nr:DNA-directed RNA polymerase subunit E'' [Candidatus Aenigmarchaeota archaeon]
MKENKRLKVCRECRLFVEGDECPGCGSTSFTHSYKGVVLIKDPATSEIAQNLEITKKGKYALWVK